MRRLLSFAAIAFGAVALRRRHIGRPVPASLAAEQVDIGLSSGSTVATYIRGPERERPVVLVHSVNAAASAAEMRPLFDRLAARRRTVAIDLPGYGRSSRPRISYTPELMANAITAALERLDEPVDLIALSLGGEFAARAALARPDLVRSVTLISPTGLGSDQSRSLSLPWLGTALRTPVVGEALYALLTSRPSIGYFLRKSFIGPVDPDMLNHARLASRHPDARYAPASFLAGSLFTPDAVAALYEPLPMPVLVIADEDAYTDFGALPGLLARRGNWRHERLAPHRGLPHFEHPDAAFESIASFVAAAGDADPEV